MRRAKAPRSEEWEGVLRRVTWGEAERLSAGGRCATGGGRAISSGWWGWGVVFSRLNKFRIQSFMGGSKNGIIREQTHDL